jgi:DUF1680 family protein
MVRDGKYVRLSTNPDKELKTSGRPEWHSVACCPPNVMRLLASLPNYFVTSNESGIQIHQYSSMDVSSGPGKLTVETEYPWDGRVKITVTESVDRPWAISLRIPGWCQNFGIKVNGRPVISDSQKGYMMLERQWKNGDIVETDLATPAFFIEADPRVDSVRGCVAIQRGPIVYCLEEQDQPQGVNLLDVRIDPVQELTSRWHNDLLGGVMTLEGTGYQKDRSSWQNHGGLYRPWIQDNKIQHLERKIRLVAIPYYAWGNRGLNSMRVWIPYT